MSDFPDLFEKIRTKVLPTAVKVRKSGKTEFNKGTDWVIEQKSLRFVFGKGKNVLFAALFDSFGGFESKNTLFCADFSRKILQIGQKAIPLPYILILK